MVRKPFTKTINGVSRYSNEIWATVGTVTVDPTTNLITVAYDERSTANEMTDPDWTSCIQFSDTYEHPKGGTIAIHKDGVEEKGVAEYELPAQTGLTYTWNAACDSSYTDVPLFTY